MSRRSASAIVLVVLVLTSSSAVAYDDAAFVQGAGQSGVALKNTIAMIFHATLLLIAGWTIWGLVREWLDGALAQRQVLVNAMRTAGLVVILGFFIR